MGQPPSTGAHRAGSQPASGSAALPESQADSGLAHAADLTTGLAISGAPLERFPGAAVIVGAKGVALDANAAGEPIAQLLRAGAGEELRTAIASAQQGRPAQVNPLLINAGQAEGAAGLAFDVAILPWGEGATVLLLARDITLERSLRAALIESRQRYKDLVEAASDFSWETDAQGRFTFISSGGALGYGAAELVGTLARDLEDGGMAGGDSPFTTRVRVQESELWVRQPEGDSACLLATALPLFGSDGTWRGARGLCRNITAARRHEARLAVDRHRERLIAYILGILRDEMDPAQVLSAACSALVPALPASGAAIYRAEADGRLSSAAQAGELPGEAAMAELTARVSEIESEAEIVQDEEAGGGVLFGRATHFQETCNGVLCLWRAGTATPWSQEDRSLLAEIAGQIGLTIRQLARQEELEKLSLTDALTGLHNRRSFLGELERRYPRRAAWHGGAALFFIDLDNFKAANDRHGHQHGDFVLMTVARILRDLSRSRDLAARLGGDEFALFVEDIGLTTARSKALEICRAVADLHHLSGDGDHPLGCSIGVAYCRPDGDEAIGEMIERADGAMYEAKRRGKGGVEIVEPGGKAGAA